MQGRTKNDRKKKNSKSINVLKSIKSVKYTINIYKLTAYKEFSLKTLNIAKKVDFPWLAGTFTI